MMSTESESSRLVQIRKVLDVNYSVLLHYFFMEFSLPVFIVNHLFFKFMQISAMVD